MLFVWFYEKNPTKICGKLHIINYTGILRMLSHLVITAVQRRISVYQRPYSGSSKKWLSTVPKRSLRRSYLYGILSFCFRPVLHLPVLER